MPRQRVPVSKTQTASDDCFLPDGEGIPQRGTHPSQKTRKVPLDIAGESKMKIGRGTRRGRGIKEEHPLDDSDQNCETISKRPCVRTSYMCHRIKRQQKPQTKECTPPSMTGRERCVQEESPTKGIVAQETKTHSKGAVKLWYFFPLLRKLGKIGTPCHKVD